MIDPHYLIQFSQSNDIYRNEACIQSKFFNTLTYDSYQICSSPLNSFQQFHNIKFENYDKIGIWVEDSYVKRFQVNFKGIILHILNINVLILSIFYKIIL
jgi:hypothetical protein